MNKDFSTKDNQIHFRAELTIEEGKIDECKKLIEEMTRLVKVNEPDTVAYEFYLNSTDETKCIVHESYADSEAALAHATRIASKKILPKIFSISKISRFEVYGSPSKELKKVLTSFNADLQSIYWIQSLIVECGSGSSKP